MAISYPSRGRQDKTIAILATGGTIASRPQTGAGVIAHLAGRDLVAGLSDPLSGITLEVQEHGSTNAFLLTADEMLEIAVKARELARVPHIDGVVVTHGTDTMEETAFLTDILYEGSSPIVFTGAQRHAAMSCPDGPRNLADAIRIAASRAATDLGVTIALEGRIDSAREATKLHTWALRAFGTHGRGSLGGIGPMGVQIHQRPRRFAPFGDLGSIEPAVHLVKLVAGIDGTLIDAAAAAGAQGIVVEAFGLGNANHRVLDALKRAIANRILVAVASRCPAGGVHPVYGNGGGYDVAAAGAIFAGCLSGPKTRILMMAVLASAREHGLDARALLREQLDAIAETTTTFDEGVQNA